MWRSCGVCSVKGNLSTSLLKIGDLWGLSLSETIRVNDWSPSGILLNSDGHQLWGMRKNWTEGLSLTHPVAMDKCLRLISPPALQATSGLALGTESSNLKESSDVTAFRTAVPPPPSAIHLPKLALETSWERQIQALQGPRQS